MTLDSRDRGLAYGDGVFETLRVTAGGQVPLWARHRARLQAGLAALSLPAPADGAIEALLGRGVASLAGQPGVVKLTITRGVGGRGYLPPSNPRLSLLQQSAPLPDWSPRSRKGGLELGLCSTVLHPEPLAGHKHLNRLPQVMARREVARQGWQEGLLLSARHQPLEATSMNLFARFSDGWWTPDLRLAGAGVAGVMRNWLCDFLAERGCPVKVDLRPLSQLRQAEAVLLCNSVVGVLPVRKLAQWCWPVTDEVMALQAEADSLFQQ